MGFSCGIIGLPNSGKSTIFNALTALSVAAQPYPFCTIEPNVGIVPVPDERLLRLAGLIRPEKVTPTTIEFIDIAGLVKDAHKGEGLGNRFLGQIREVDAVAHVVRCFEGNNVPHVYATIDPERDMEIIETEIIISDLEIVEERLDKIERLAKVSKEKHGDEQDVLLKVKALLEAGRFIDSGGLRPRRSGRYCRPSASSPQSPSSTSPISTKRTWRRRPSDACRGTRAEKGRKVVSICGSWRRSLPCCLPESGRTSWRCTA